MKDARSFSMNSCITSTFMYVFGGCISIQGKAILDDDAIILCMKQISLVENIVRNRMCLITGGETDSGQDNREKNLTMPSTQPVQRQLE